MPKVLMIEDDLDFAAIMLECLQADPQCEIDEVITTQEDARFKFECGGLHNVDAVLVDLNLVRARSDHRVNSAAGFELIAEMRHRHQFRGQIIVLTNSSAQSDGKRALEAGCDGYLCKHVRSGDLSGLISELRMALRGDVVMVSRQMRHIFMKRYNEGVSSAELHP